MKTKIIKPVNLMLMLLLAAAFAMPVVVEAGRGHHRFGHSHHHPQHHPQHHHYERHGHRHAHHHHRKHHYKRRHHAYYGGYNRVYNPPRRFANRRYYRPRPQQYGYGRHYGHYPPAPVYGYPTNGMLGIHTGNARFMVRY